MSDNNTELSENVKQSDETPKEKIEAIALKNNNEKYKELANLTNNQVKGVEDATKPAVTNVLIRQKMSGNDIMPEECKVGELYDTDGEVVGDKLEFIPIFSHIIRKKWSETEEGNSVDCMSLDGKVGSKYGACDSCPYGRFEPGKKMQCSKGRTFFGVTPELNKLYKIDFIKTSAKAGNQIMRLVRPPALWAKSFFISVNKEKSSSGFDYYMFNAKPSGHKIEGDLYEICDALYEHFREMYQSALEYHKRMRETNTLEAPHSSPTDGETIEVQEGENIDFSESL